ncbi:hypothetical protein EsDP_00007116, partial [Epichloe bromicola]
MKGVGGEHHHMAPIACRGLQSQPPQPGRLVTLDESTGHHQVATSNSSPSSTTASQVVRSEALSVAINTRTFHSTAEVVKEFLPQVEQDPVVLALGPQEGKDMKAQLEAWSDALLVVATCLREDAEGRDGQDAEVKVKTGEEIEVEAEAEPTIVGTMCLDQ